MMRKSRGVVVRAALTATLSGIADFLLDLTYTPAASPSPSPSPTSSSPSGQPVKGYDGKCLDDTGNSSANRAKVQIWTCNGDRAQLWTYSNGELIHTGKCANDKAAGRSGSKVILWTCNHARNELWFHSSSNDEFVLNDQAHGLLCLDDPAYSTRNGTALIVYRCKDSANQRWSALP